MYTKNKLCDEMTNHETPISDLGVQAKTGRRATTKFERQISYRTVPFHSRIK